MSGDEKRLNPQIKEVEIGVRNLRKIKIYPMSMADQTKFLKLMEEALNSYFKHSEGEKLTENKLMPFISSLVELVGKNVYDFMNIVLDPDEIKAEDFFKDVTNLQMSEIVVHIVEDNFGGSAKNVISLIDRFKELFLLRRQSQQFLKDTLNLDSDTSIEEALEKED